MSGVVPLLGFAVVLMTGTFVFSVINTGFVVSVYNKDTDALSRTRIFVNGTSCYAGEARRKASYRARELAAYEEYALPVPCHTDNGDEALYAANRLGSFSKGLQHDSLGIVNPTSYAILLQAVQSGVSAHFDLIPTAGTLKLTSPQAGLAFSLVGGDSHSFYQAPSPAFASRAFAHELAENYWMALCRDVPFADYGTESQTLAAAAELSTFSEYGGPLPTVASTNLFRGTASGCSTGPYISQFLYGPCWFGASQIDMKLTPPTAGANFLTSWSEFLSVQNGNAPSGTLTYGPTPRYIITGRDLSHWVHIGKSKHTLANSPPLYFHSQFFPLFRCSPPSVFSGAAHVDEDWSPRQGIDPIPDRLLESGGICHLWRPCHCSVGHRGVQRCSQGSLVPEMDGPSQAQTRGCRRTR